MKEEKRSPVGIGLLSVFNILLILTLAVFAALTLSSARADLALAQRGAETVRAYYAGETLTPNDGEPDSLPVWDGTLPN